MGMTIILFWCAYTPIKAIINTQSLKKHVIPAQAGIHSQVIVSHKSFVDYGSQSV